MATMRNLHVRGRLNRYNAHYNRLVPGSSRRVRARSPRTGFQGRVPSELAQDALSSWQGCSADATGIHSNGCARRGSQCGQVQLRQLPRCVLTCTAAGSDGGSTTAIGDDWKWHQPIMDGALSSADRAVLALARAAANLSDKLLVEQAASTHGLSLVTTSDVCVGPLVPPFGSTLEDDGEEGDGMAPPPPPPSSREPTTHQRGSGSPLAGFTGSSLLGAVFPGAHSGTTAVGSRTATSTAVTKPSPAAPAAARPAAAGGAAGLGLLKSAAVGGAGARPTPPPAAAAAALPPLARHGSMADVWLKDLALIVAGGGGGDDDDEGEDEQVRQAFAERSGRGGVVELAAEASGLMGTAAAALTRVMQAAAASAADVPAPVGRAASGAASAAAHAAQAAVAAAAKATAQMLPNYGDPSCSWLVADDPVGGVRYIVIEAGPDLRRRAPTGLMTDLVTFESYNLGVKVNKRLYSEATALYARFIPLVMDFLEASPEGNICFGGQGVGGSLAVLLQLMSSHRGLRFARLLPAVAVDSPAVLAQVPLEQRRMWGSMGREQQRQLSQDSMEDVLEDLLQRSVLEELGLPQDAVRNIVLPPPPPPAQPASAWPSRPSQPSPMDILSARPLVSAWNGAGQHQTTATVAASPAAAAAAHVLVLPSAASAAGGDGIGGAAGAAAAGSARPQVFRLVGKIVHVQTIGSVSIRMLSPPKSATAGVPKETDARAAGVVVLETDGGSGELATVAAAAAGAPLSGGFGATKRLDMAMVGSIASAAAAAAAAAAVERLRHVSAGAFRTASSEMGRPAAVTAATAPLAMAAAAVDNGALRAGTRRAAAALVSKGSGPDAQQPVVLAATAAGLEGEEEEEDWSVWGV